MPQDYLNYTVLTFNAFSHPGSVALCLFHLLPLEPMFPPALPPPCFVDYMNLGKLAEELTTAREIDFFFWNLDLVFWGETIYCFFEKMVCERALLSTHLMCAWHEKSICLLEGCDRLLFYIMLEKHDLGATRWSLCKDCTTWALGYTPLRVSNSVCPEQPWFVFIWM